MFGQESGGKRFRLYENVGYIHTTDPSNNDIKVLDLPDKLLLNAGASVAVTPHVEFLTEIAHTHYVGQRTPNLPDVAGAGGLNPVDLNIGLRFFFKNGAISFGGGYRRNLNNMDDLTLPVFVGTTIFCDPTKGPCPTPKVAPQFFIINPFFQTQPQTFPSEGG